MNIINLPQPLSSILNCNNFCNETQETTTIFNGLMVAMVELLQCDRCFLYLRDPQLQMGQILHCHCVHPEIPNLRDSQPYLEPIYLAAKNPLFAAALQCERNVFLDRIDSVSSYKSDFDFFQQNYEGQKSLIQAHICSQNELWGIFQASQFKRSRPWTKFDRDLTITVIDRITPLVTMHVKRQLRHTMQVIHDGNQ